MKAGYMKSPYEFAVRDIELRNIREDEVLISVKACSVCGYDMILAQAGTDEWSCFGHEIAGVVEKAGRLVKNVAVGDKVVLESGSFDRFSDYARNGRADLDATGPNFWQTDGAMGFAEKMIAPMEACVRFDAISFEAACLVEPLGVAYDLVQTADIKLGNVVLVMGLGPIGLMAARLAKLSGASKVYATELPACEARIALSREWGVDAVFPPDDIPVTADRVLVTAPPKVIPSALAHCNRDGIVAFIGIADGAESVVSFDANAFHFSKLQLRGSHASPAMYFPECLRLVREGFVDTAALVTHRFTIDGLSEGILAFRDDRKHAIKAVMLHD